MGLLAHVSKSSPYYRLYLTVAIFVSVSACVTAILLVAFMADRNSHGICVQASVCHAMRVYWKIPADAPGDSTDVFLVRVWLALSGVPALCLFLLLTTKTILRTNGEPQKADMKPLFLLFVLLIPYLLILFARNPVSAPDVVRSVSDWGRWLFSLGIYYVFQFFLTLTCVMYLWGRINTAPGETDVVK